jgi:transcriptional regulator with XRE-family HTH domain
MEEPVMSPSDAEGVARSGEIEATVSLGQYLASIRKDRRLSLRAVEEKTNKQVSNAYLSQIENNQIQQPSPNILNALAELYGISLTSLMEKAGYITPSVARETTERHGRLATFAEHNLTPEEEIELMEYLEFMRNRKRPR